ncbi:MAG: DUF4912 domain-containing protein [Cyanobacteriota bacterium]|nr:DUF4912 domain-containing protein [Cyanobacteriota bacterium]
MVGSPRGTSGLQSLPIRRLRELARSLRVHLFSRLSRNDLINAIGRRTAGPSSGPAVAAEAQPPQASPPAAEPSPSSGAVAMPEAASWLLLEAIDSPWVQLRWQLNASDRQRLRQEAGDRPRLRLADVTDRMNPGTPQTQLEVQPDGGTEQWQVALPLLGRLYRAELGFRRVVDDSWVTLAQAGPLWVEQASDAPAAAAAPGSVAVDHFPVGTWVPTGVPAIHERVYQAATTLHRRRSLGASEEFQDHGLEGQHLAAAGAAAGFTGSGAGFSGSGAGFSGSGAGLGAPGLWASGLWESGRSDSGLGGVPPRQRSFWLVADAELIVYGATDPAARLTIGDDEVPLSAEGTFHCHVAFRDGEQLWPIEAVAADGEQRRNITLSFERRTPEAHVNTPDEAEPEWF